jgi:mono/diheme cytochrome c family protein
LNGAVLRLTQRAGLWLAALPLATLAQATNGPAEGTRFPVEQIEAGRAQFHRTCAQCHGRNMVNAGTTVFDLRKFRSTTPSGFNTA